jgi:hypothetical protein
MDTPTPMNRWDRQNGCPWGFVMGSWFVEKDLIVPVTGTRLAMPLDLTRRKRFVQDSEVPGGAPGFSNSGWTENTKGK